MQIVSSQQVQNCNTILCRAHKEDEGECEASECNLLCEDMLRAGFSRFVVDPGVRQAYYPDTARQLYTKKVPPCLDVALCSSRCFCRPHH